MFINLSAKYYQENKDRLQIKFVKDIKIFLRKKKGKSDNIFVNVIKISQEMKKKSLLSIQKNLIEREKMPFYNYNKRLLLKN